MVLTEHSNDKGVDFYLQKANVHLKSWGGAKFYWDATYSIGKVMVLGKYYKAWGKK